MIIKGGQNIKKSRSRVYWGWIRILKMNILNYLIKEA